MRSLLLACVSAAVVVACIDFGKVNHGFLTSEVHWRVDEQRDVAEWLEIEHGLVGEEETHLSNVVDVLEGWRVFPAHGGFPSIDLDEIERDLAAKPEETDVSGEPDEPDELDLALHELAPTFSIVEAALVIDEEGRATLWRRGRLENASKWLRLVEDEILEDIAESQPREPDEPAEEFPIPRLELEDASWDLLRSHARGGGRLWRFDRDAFLAEIPMTEADAKRCIGAMERDDVEASFRDGTLRLRHLPGAGGWIRSRALEQTHQGKVEYDASIVARLVASGAAVEPVERYRERRAAAGLR